jgi:hypothetical protein
MATYYFNLKDGRNTVPDIDGTELIDDAGARAHAVLVAREAMRNNEKRTRNWRIQVCGADRKALFEVLFASVDETIDHLHPEIRQSVENVSTKFASLSDAIHDVRMSMLELRTTLARSEGAPHLVALNGLRVWKER